MSKRRSDWETRPQARFRKWMREGFLGLDEEIADTIGESSRSNMDAAELHEKHREMADSRRHDRDVALDRLAQYDFTTWAHTEWHFPGDRLG